MSSCSCRSVAVGVLYPESFIPVLYYAFYGTTPVLVLIVSRKRTSMMSPLISLSPFCHECSNLRVEWVVGIVRCLFPVMHKCCKICKALRGDPVVARLHEKISQPDDNRRPPSSAREMLHILLAIARPKLTKKVGFTPYFWSLTLTKSLPP